MVNVEVSKESRGYSTASVTLELQSEEIWYSIGSSELCDINTCLFCPDDEIKIAVFRGFIYVRFGKNFLCGARRLTFQLSRNTRVSCALSSDSFLIDRAFTLKYFESFSAMYLSMEYKNLRRNLVSSSDRFLDFTQNESEILDEITRQVSAHTHLLSFTVGFEISKIFQAVLAVYCDFCFEGPLFGFLSDSAVTEVVVNGSRDLWVERDGCWERRRLPFSDWSSVEHWLLFQSSFSNTDIFGNGFFSDFVIRSGARVHVCRMPIARTDGYVSIRRHREMNWNLSDLLESGFIDRTQMETLLTAIDERLNILVVGPTSSGKTTLLGAMAANCKSGERIIVLEDTPELRIGHDHVVYLQTSAGSSVEENSVNLIDLVRNSLRMRPDRIIVGECRGDEVYALLNALQTGHRGSMCTLHAESAEQALLRLQVLLQRAHPSITDPVASKMIALGLDLIVCVGRKPTGERTVIEIGNVGALS